MALKFTLHQGKVLPDPNTELIEEFQDIIQYGKKKDDTDLSNRMLLYVFWCCDLTDDNPFRDLDYRLKEEQALNRCLKSYKGNKKTFTKTEMSLIEAAMDAYNFFNENSLERVANAYDRKIDELRSDLDGMRLEIHHVTNPDTGEVIRIVSNEKIIDNIAKQIVDLAGYKLRALEAAKKIENKGRVRGDKGSSLIETGRFRRDREI